MKFLNIKRYKNGQRRPEYSYFRYGLDFILFLYFKDILKEPEFQEGTIDTEELAEKYYRSQIPIFTISIILLLVPFIDGRLFLARYEMSFLLLPVSLIFCYFPEFILFRKITSLSLKHFFIRFDLKTSEPQVVHHDFTHQFSFLASCASVLIQFDINPLYHK